MPARKTAIFSFLVLIFTLGFPNLVIARVGHALDVVLMPADGSLSVSDTVTLPTAQRRVEFVLNAGFDVVADSGALVRLKDSTDGSRTVYRLTWQTPTRTFGLQYHGQPRFSARRSMGGMPAGAIDSGGVYLDGASAWYPMFDTEVARLDLSLTLPEGWHGISIGKRGEKDGRETWSTAKPHDDIYLLAGPFTRHARRAHGVDLSVLLLDDDPALAARYLDLSADYIAHYDRLIGDYPFAKFAVVENRWQTGFGMPSFTLLGSRVLRLPFIPYTSLPHEILHNWWGNGVWIDYAKGNWSEGLTAYLADHWMKERQGRGAEYRLKALQRYSNFARDGHDSALVEFVSRHNDASQSVGYSKSLMVFHTLRLALGDAAFVDALRRLWLTHQFQAVGFAEVVRTLTAGDPALGELAAQWLYDTGAPQLVLGETRVERRGDGYRLHVELRQDGPGFRVRVPLAVTEAGSDTATYHWVTLDDAGGEFTLDLERRPLRIDVDPAYDVLRYLDPSEQPPALNRLFGAPTLLLLPTRAASAERAAWRRLAAQWQRRYPRLEVAEDDIDALPNDRNVLLAGWDNRLLDRALPRLARDDQAVTRAGLSTGASDYPATAFSSVVVNNDAAGITTGFLGAGNAAEIATLARKLPHYGSYGRLVFDGVSGENRVKHSLTSSHSTMSRQLGATPVPLRLPPRPILGAATD
jgi:hypothetical protein